MAISGQRPTSPLRIAGLVISAFLVWTGTSSIARAQAISPSAGCTAANAGAYNLSVSSSVAPVTLDITEDFGEGEILTFSTTIEGSISTARATDETASVVVFDTTSMTSGDYSIPATGSRDFELELQATNVTSSADLTVACTPAQGSISITKISDVDGAFQFAGDLGSFTIDTAGEAETELFASVFAGTYVVSEIVDGSIANLESIVCTGDTDGGSVINAAAAEVAIDLDAGEDINCTFSNVDAGDVAPGNTPTNPTSQQIVDVSQHVVRNFLYRRASELLNAEPDRASIVRRNPDLLWHDDTNYRIKADSSGVDAAFSSSAHSILNSGLNLWIEGQYSSYRHNNTARSDGEFGVVYLGADYFVHENLLVGVLGQFDWTRDETPIVGEIVDGDGWMVGPYVSTRLAQNLFVDVRGAWGKSNNSLSIQGFVTDDEFDTTRWLLSAALTGSKQYGNWRITPKASVSYLEEEQDAYLSTSGVQIGSQTVALGRAVFEPEIGYRHETESGIILEPHASLGAVWDFESPEGLSIPGWLVTTDDFRLRTEVGLIVSFPQRFAFRIAGGYDGIGSSNYRSYSARLWLDVPLGSRPPKPRNVESPASLKECSSGMMVPLTETCPASALSPVMVDIDFKSKKASISPDSVQALEAAWNDASNNDIGTILFSPGTSDAALAALRLDAVNALLRLWGGPTAAMSDAAVSETASVTIAFH